MKRLLTLTPILVSLAATTGAQAARESGPSTGGVFVNPLGTFYGPLTLELDYGVGTRASLNFTGARWSHLRAGGVAASAWSIGAGAQMFAVGPLYEGVFAFPMLHWLWLDVAGEPGTEQRASLAGVAPQVLFGYQFDWKVVSLRLGLGGFYIVPLPEGELEDSTHLDGLEGLRLAVDLSLGVTL